MNQTIPNWLTARILTGFSSTRQNSMDELVWQSSAQASRFARRCIGALMTSGADDDPLDPPEPHVQPTPTDVPVPEPADVPAPEPRDVPPPKPKDVPPPKSRPVP
jgi:outer membrane biosynthesis protein TonB